MPTVTLDRKEFEKFVGMHLPDDKLKDRISMIGTDLESLNEKEIVVEILRPDAPVVFKAKGNETFVHIIMPVRIQNSE